MDTHLGLRIAVGVTILAGFAIEDIWRNGRNARRWREYCFLALCVLVAMAYGAINDQITSSISWEYFYWGKELWPILGPPPPDALALHLQAAKIGIEATWSAGLVAGSILLIANNPGRNGPPLSYRQLAGRLPSFIGITIVCSAVFGVAGHYYLLNGISPDFSEMVATDFWRPRRFMMVYGIHLGGYVGGAIGVIYNVGVILRQRKNGFEGENV